MYNCKQVRGTSQSEQTPPDQKRRWTLLDDKKGTDGYIWVAWEDGYDPETNKFNDVSQIWELNCAELCGAFHFRMIGRVYVHKDEADFRLWLETAEKRQNDFGTPAVTAHGGH
jgi:hypothetical protein